MEIDKAKLVYCIKIIRASLFIILLAGDIK